MLTRTNVLYIMFFRTRYLEVHIMDGEKEEYREMIIEMVKEIENHSIIKLIYYYVQSGYNEEKAGK